ncbi:MAG: trypsin-like peptidase domain-containing protein, partial [Abitibacteriaceae bacterium]|nr:trypsin-like peptidase domain-containing protein [Abditibacteriaceae bacterium]
MYLRRKLSVNALPASLLSPRVGYGVSSLVGLSLLLALPPQAPLYAADNGQDTPPTTATTDTAASPTAHPVLTADAVQEAFVRVADRLKPSVVTIIAEHKPKPRSTDSTTKPDSKSDKNSGSKKPGGKPDDRAQKPDTPADPNDPGDNGDDEGDSPFGFPPLGPRDPHERLTSLGTGMVVRSDGYILTNYHVVKGANFVRVLFNADSENPDRPAARVVGYDEESDLAILKVERTNLQAIEFADFDKVR